MEVANFLKRGQQPKSGSERGAWLQQGKFPNLHVIFGEAKNNVFEICLALRCKDSMPVIVQKTYSTENNSTGFSHLTQRRGG